MANTGYDPQYAAARRRDIEAQITANKAEGKRLAEALKQYPTARAEKTED